MSYYLDNIYSQDYGRRTEIYRNYQYNPEKRRTINQNLSSSKMRDNSAILRRAINKRYKEDINKNIIKSDNYDDNDDNEVNDDNEYNNNEYYGNNLNNDYNDYRNNNFYNNNNFNNNINYYSNNKSHNNNYNENNYYDQALISRIYNNRIRNNINSNIRNNYSSYINKDNMYDEFIINYNLGINKEDNFERNKLNKNPTQFIKNSKNYNINNQLYSRKTSNNFFRDKYLLNSNDNNNNNFTNSQIEYIYRPQIENNEDIKVPYHKRRINNYAYKDNKENGMANTNYLNISKNKGALYLRNNLENDSFYSRNKINNFNTFDSSNNYERNYNIINENSDKGNNYENNTNNNNEEYFNINDNYNNQNIDLDLYSEANERISDFLQHVIQYCFLYYFKIIQKVFTFLKNQKNKPKIKKYNKIIPKIKDANKNINIKNKAVKTTNYLKKYQTYSDMRTKSNLNKTEEKNERLPYHKNNYNNENNTITIIERIKSKNESVSPNKKNNVEMFRNFDELNKKYEIINNRKNRMSYNNTKRSLNDLSFNSENRAIYRNSVDKNKEIFENNINKERERKKKILERKKKKEKSKILKEKEKEQNNLEIKNNKNKSEEENNELSKLIKKNEELKKKIQKAIEDNKLELKKDNKDLNKNNINKIPTLERKKIREKYKKKNINKINDKYEMIDVKKISTKDKSIYINIKYLNFIPMKNKNKKENNDKYKLYQICNNLNISLFAIKDNNGNKKKIKKENIDYNNNNYLHKLSSIQEENKIDLNELSDSISHKSDEKTK